MRITVRRLLPFAALAMCIFTLAESCYAKKRDIPPAPLPEAISKAKHVFATNGGGNQLAFDEFYSQMKQWGRFQLVGSPSEADIIMQLRFATIDKGERVYSTYNAYTKQTSIGSVDVVDPQLTLDIYDPSSKALLWSETDHRRLARREKNREKETVNSADRIVEELKEHIAIPQ